MGKIQKIVLEAKGLSAGNQKFFLISDHAPKHRKPKSQTEFAYFLAGLLEGAGCFTENRLEIKFQKSNLSNAFFVKKMIGFGQVQNNKYILYHKIGLRKVITLLNGKMSTDSLLSNHYLAGFTDATGYFYIRITTSKKIILEYNLKFTSKNLTIIKKIQQVFGGSIWVAAQHNKVKQSYLLANCSIPKEDELLLCAKNDTPANRIYEYSSNEAYRIINYFDRFHCNSPSKLVGFFKWRKVYRILQRNEHLTLKGFDKVLRIKRMEYND
uniref:Putative intron-encoded protein n=1 Tax=Chaetosphaeridium globosum TaxID=96477 RepID=Q8M1D3_CHAGL|nr:putative intron-encoded protein [Chaetosphaeridium globosum]AAM96641.1 putative intron-encoded protein [Chaetosphaeridium globosum]